MTNSPETEKLYKIEDLVTSMGLEFTAQMKFRYFNDTLVYALFSLVLGLLEEKEVKEMRTDKEMEFFVKTIKSLKQENEDLRKQINGLEKRIKALEPEQPDELLVRNARGEIVVYLVRDADGNYIDPRLDKENDAD